MSHAFASAVTETDLKGHNLSQAREGIFFFSHQVPKVEEGGGGGGGKEDQVSQQGLTSMIMLMEKAVK